MKAVLDELGSMNPPPIEKQEPRVAREEPSPADAVASLLSKRGRPTVMAVAGISHKVIHTQDGDILVRIYRGKGAPAQNSPGVVYFHGGGWVIGGLNTYDASCREIANMAHCVVMSVAYRLAPENKFPAAHDDAYNSAKWLMSNASSMGCNPNNFALAGESAGGNLAVATALRMKRAGDPMPKHILSVYPIADYDFETPSYREEANAKPLNREMMKWFFMHYLNSPEEGHNDYISLVNAKDLAGLPPTTIVLDEIDPLRSEGEMLTQALQAAHVPVQMRLYKGATHEFFGMGAVVPQALAAETFATSQLRAAFR